MSEPALSSLLSHGDLTGEKFGPVIDAVLARLGERGRPLPDGVDPNRATKQYWMDALARAVETPEPIPEPAPTPAPAPEVEPTPAPPLQPMPEAERRTHRHKVVLVACGTILACAGVGGIVWGVTQLGGDSDNSRQGVGGSTASTPAQTSSASEQQDSPTPSSSSGDKVQAAQEPRIDISGTCVREGDRFTVKSSGFSGRYTVQIFDPAKRPYPLPLGNQGTANPDGTVNTTWPCEHKDLPGTYTVEITDGKTGKVARDTFQVDAV
ncbi:hypothetical protein [Streptomyces sp. NPDC059271]|uniref:hypothetical protein n=1 Tax=Streptomyces sp. NPDC059271 TaxID=3346799 RepID=UPI0036CBFF0E